MAIIPAALTIYIAGPKATLALLLLSQCILSMQLPFAIIPLIHFTSDRRAMGSFANRAWVQVLAWMTAAVIIALNCVWPRQTIGEWVAAAGPLAAVHLAGRVPAGHRVACCCCSGSPSNRCITRRCQRRGRATAALPEAASPGRGAPPVYQRILLPLDHTELDRLAVTHAAAMARLMRQHLPAARGRRSHQPDLRRRCFHCRSRSRPGIS